MSYPKALDLLRRSLHNPDAQFHQDQWESIDTLVNKRERLLVVQRTGWGKSSVYFIATNLLRQQGSGPTIIISPLLALMRNQIDSAAKYGVRLASINSSNSIEANKQAQFALLKDELDAVIISPERLANSAFVQDVLLPVTGNVGLFVIDEAHCISDWGHDFRPDYKRIGQILKYVPTNTPVLATTATANKRVMQDVANQIGENIRIFRGQLTRDSLRLQNIVMPRRSQRLAWLATTLKSIEGTGIIYTATIRDSQQVAEWLQQCDINAQSYSGSMQANTRLKLEDDLLNNRLQALVATSALGMCYDKPDLAFVIHYQSPGSVISYYQQVGRAGRGIDKAYGVLLSGREDDEIQQFFMRNAFPNEELVQTILEKLADSEQGLKLAELTSSINDRAAKIEAALKYLSAEHPPPVLKQGSFYLRTSVEYSLPHAAIARLVQGKQNEWQQMQKYLLEKNCLMQFLANALDDELAEPCGKCSNCASDQALPEMNNAEFGRLAIQYLEDVIIEIEPKKRVANGKAQARHRFPQFRFEYQLGNLAHETGRVLCNWGDPGWGELVKKGQSSDQFDPRVVDACVRLIRQRWQPDPAPTWVTFIPSQNHPRMVAEFARSLAEQLGLPLITAITKVGKSEPQKDMGNSDFRCKNLDGAFSVDSVMKAEPVLLIDDAVDSGWTFTVVAALLRREGSGPVFPMAVMKTSNS